MLTPGETAYVDQTLQAISDIEREWPHNQALMDDPEVSRVVWERLGEEWEQSAPGAAYVLWANGRMVRLPLAESMTIVATVLLTAPQREAECDRCRITHNIAGIAVVAVAPLLVPLVLCWNCADCLDPESLLQIGVRDA